MVVVEVSLVMETVVESTGEVTAANSLLAFDNETDKTALKFWYKL